MKFIQERVWGVHKWGYVLDEIFKVLWYLTECLFSVSFQWLSSQDPEGKIYYYEENSTKSSWFLPVPGISFNDDSVRGYSGSLPLFIPVSVRRPCLKIKIPDLLGIPLMSFKPEAQRLLDF